MACPEVVELINAVRINGQCRLNNLEQALRPLKELPLPAHRQPLPREVNSDQIAKEAEHVSLLLSEAYVKQAQRNRDSHGKRMTKYQSYPAPSSRPVSQAEPAPHTRAPLPGQPAAAQ